MRSAASWQYGLWYRGAGWCGAVRGGAVQYRSTAAVVGRRRASRLSAGQKRQGNLTRNTTPPHPTAPTHDSLVQRVDAVLAVAGLAVVAAQHRHVGGGDQQQAALGHRLRSGDGGQQQQRAAWQRFSSGQQPPGVSGFKTNGLQQAAELQ